MIYTNKFIKECSLYENEESITEGYLSDIFTKVNMPEDLKNSVKKYFKEVKKIVGDFEAYSNMMRMAKNTVPFKNHKDFDKIMDNAEKGIDKDGKQIGFKINLSKIHPPKITEPGEIARDINNVFVTDGFSIMPKSKNILKSTFQERAMYKETKEYFYIIDTNLIWTTYNGVFSSYEYYYANFYAIPNNEKSRKRLNLNESTHTSIFESVNI